MRWNDDDDVDFLIDLQGSAFAVGVKSQICVENNNNFIITENILDLKIFAYFFIITGKKRSLFAESWKKFPFFGAFDRF